MRVAILLQTAGPSAKPLGLRTWSLGMLSCTLFILPNLMLPISDR